MPAVLLSTLLAGLFLIWNPHVPDLAAHTFRTELFEQTGFSIWNGSWYEGHYLLSYSVLFPPLAALLGPVAVGALSAVSSAYLFDRLVREHWGERAGWATLWYAATAVILLANGWLTFALGVAFALASLRALQRGHLKLSCLAAAACALASPVAAVFLAGVVAAAVAARRRWRADLSLLGVAVVAAGLVVALSLAFPDAGRFPFVFSSFIAVPLWVGGALYLTRGMRQERQFRFVIVAYAGAAMMAWLLPNPLGGNMVRLGVLFGGPVLAAVLLAHRPRVPVFAVAIVLLGSVYWQLHGAVADVARSAGDPSTKAQYYRPLADWLGAHGGHRARVEVPFTRNHWESAYLAPDFDLARGWLRQLDRTRNHIFYERELSSPLYRAWLERNGVRYVAVPDARPDYSAEAERRLIEQQPSYLRPVWSSAHWQVYRVVGSRPLVRTSAGSARLAALGSQHFTLRVSRPGRFTVRVHPTPFWKVAAGDGCVTRAGSWTGVRADRPGLLRVSIGFSLSRTWRSVRGSYSDC